MFLTMFKNSSPKNEARKVEQGLLTHLIYGDNNQVPCDVVRPCAIDEPVFILGSQYFDFNQCNYLYCDTFNRYYFINKPVLLNNGMIELHCTSDPFYSFIDGIRGIQTIVERTEDTTKVNPYIPDNEIMGRVDREFIKKKIGTVGGQATGTHIALTVTGGE